MASAFKDYTAVHHLQTSTNLAEFDGTRIAVDADDYLHTLLTNPQTREPLLPALGGLPFALEKHVNGDLTGFAEAGITVVWVFNGLDCASRSQGVVGREGRRAAEGLSHAWDIYDSGRGDEAVLAFGKNCTYKTDHITRWLLSHLHKRGQTVLVAPYTAAAQCVYLESTAHVDAIAGSASALVFGADKVITSFDFAHNRLAWVELKTLLGNFLLNQSGFEDLMLISGCVDVLLPALSELEAQDSGAARVSSARALLNRFNGDGHAVALSQTQLKPAETPIGAAAASDYLDCFRKAKYAIRYAVHLTSSGSVTPVNPDKVPNDVHDFVGQRLPEELYYYLSRGLIGPRVLNWRTKMIVYETPPLDGVGGPVYRDMVRGSGITELRAQSLGLLTKSLHRYYQKTDVDLVCWFNEGDKRRLGIPDRTEPAASTHLWQVKTAALPKLPENIPGSPVETPLSYAIFALSDFNEARYTFPFGSTPLAEPPELVANITWRFLHERGYINPDHTLSHWGRALRTSLLAARAHPTSHDHARESDDALFLAFELHRLNLLHPATPTPNPPNFSGAPLRGTPQDKSHTTLLARLATLASFSHAPIGYTGPLSRTLLAYQSLTTTLRGALRDSLEMQAANLFLSASASRNAPSTILTEVGTRLPLGGEPDLGLALLVKSWLDELSQEPSRRGEVGRWFNHAADIPGDLERVWRLWNALNAGLQSADLAVVNTDARKRFADVDVWLKEKLAVANASHSHAHAHNNGDGQGNGNGNGNDDGAAGGVNGSA